MKKLLDCLLCCFALAASGCYAKLQTSDMILEDGIVCNIAMIPRTKEAYADGIDICIKVPIRPHIRKHTLVEAGVTPSYFGGYAYKEIEEHDASPAHIWLSFNAFTISDPRFEIAGFQLLGSDDFKIRFLQRCAVPDSISNHRLFFSMDGSPPQRIVNSFVSYHDQNASLRHFSSFCAKYFFDLPVSLFMTCTGSIVYLPLTRIPSEAYE